MLIEFCCPVCKAPLAIQKQAMGGQVNCPKCQKVILLPSESPLSRVDEETPPFSPGQKRDVEEVAEAVHISVDPYRRDLENKTELLNDAVEMIKVRNERIKEIESLMLETQRDLWALEVEHDAAKTKHRHTQSLLRETRDQMREMKTQGEEHHEAEETLRKRVEELEAAESTLISKKERLKARLANVIALAERLEGEVKRYRDIFSADGEAAAHLDGLSRFLETHVAGMADQTEELETARELLGKAASELLRLREDVESKDRQRMDLEELVKSSSVDMQNALDDRKQWRNHAQELEKKQAELEARYQEEASARENALQEREVELSACRAELEEARKILKEREEDIRLLQATRKELEESLELWRGRQQEAEKERRGAEEERREEEAQRREALEQERERLLAGHRKETERLQQKLEKATAELEETEESLAEALETQNKLTRQSLQSEKQRKELKKALSEAEDHISELESS